MRKKPREKEKHLHAESMDCPSQYVKANVAARVVYQPRQANDHEGHGRMQHNAKEHRHRTEKVQGMQSLFVVVRRLSTGLRH
jgi:hypothetical protein